MTAAAGERRFEQWISGAALVVLLVGCALVLRPFATSLLWAIVLWLAIVISPWIAVASTVVATFWDVWHSGAQTFGFARIYERNHGTPPELGRRLDFWLQQLLYAGPILAGATLMDHVDSFDNIASVGDALFSSVPARDRWSPATGRCRTITTRPSGWCPAC